MKQKKYGFTLAETLITLFIIGIIATLILPNITDAFRQKAVDASALRTANLLEEVVTQSMFTENDVQKNTIDAIVDDLSTNNIFNALNAPSISSADNNSFRVGKQDATFTYRSRGSDPNDADVEEINGIEVIGTIYIDGNGSKGPNANVVARGDGNDRYKFYLMNNGTVVPANNVARSLTRGDK